MPVPLPSLEDSRPLPLIVASPSNENNISILQEVVQEKVSDLPEEIVKASPVKNELLTIKLRPLTQIFTTLTHGTLSVNPSLIWWEGIFSYQPYTLTKKAILFSKWVLDLSVKKGTP